MGEDRLWEGDAGTLPLEVRVAVARLISDYAVDDTVHVGDRLLLDVIADNRDDVERALADCMLVLVVRERHHVAWAEPAHVEGMHDVRGPKVAKRASGTTAFAMCVCREVALECEAAGDDVATIDADVLAERLSEMSRWRQGRDAKSVADATRRAIESMCRQHLLRPRRGSSDYEIRPLLSAIVDEAWLREVAQDAQGGAPDGADASDDVDDGAAPSEGDDE